MIDRLDIRVSAPHDRPAIEAVYPDAFPDEDLLPLLCELLTGEHDVISLVGAIDGCVVGHVVFTMGTVGGDQVRAALLAPLAVASSWHGRGIGSQIVHAGLERLRDNGVGHVFVLGDPNYYRRFGFVPEVDVEPPYPLPEAWRVAWQSIKLGDEDAPASGMIRLPHPWLRPELWAP